MSSRLGQAYQSIYIALAGKGSRVKPWHFQWLAIYQLHRDLRARLSSVRGRLLDVGCGEKPYGVFLDPSVEHVGVDLMKGATVDVVMDGLSIPLPDQAFDAILCTQVMEHAEHAGQLRDEMLRCLKPGGMLFVSVPFLYNEHGTPADFRRFSRRGVVQFFETGVEVVEVKEVLLEGGIGSTVGVLLLNWWDAQLDHFKLTRFLKAPFLPVFLVVSLLVNIVGYVMDKLDFTNLFYNNLLLVGVKREPEKSSRSLEEGVEC